jgi:hypothetical protein
MRTPESTTHHRFEPLTKRESIFLVIVNLVIGATFIYFLRDKGNPLIIVGWDIVFLFLMTGAFFIMRAMQKDCQEACKRLAEQEF